jgi:hypothetical protein
MKRRRLLRVSAAAVGGGAATLAGLQAAGESAAQTALTLSIAGDSATLGADESVTALLLTADVEWAYDLPDSAAPSTVVVELAAATDGEPDVVASAESAQLFTEAEGTESFEVGLLGEVVDPSALAPASGSRKTTVTVEARLRVESDGGEVLARETASDEAPVTVERDSVDASAYGSVGGSGSLTIETG